MTDSIFPLSRSLISYLSESRTLSIKNKTNTQKLLFNRLRFTMDYHLLSRNADIDERIALTNAIRDDLMEYDRTHDDDIHPKEVQRRLDIHRLYAKYILRDEIAADSDSMDVDQAPIDYKVQVASTSRPSGEPIKRTIDTVKPMIKIMQKNMQSKECVKSGQSLLKPRPQWNQAKNGHATYGKLPTVETEKPAAPIQLGRMKLQEALHKAKGGPSTAQPQPSTSPPQSTQQLKTRESPDSMLSSSQSSNASSSEEADSIDKNLAANTTVDVDEMTQEEFLRIFRLYTHEHSHYLKTRKPQKRRRNCTTMSARADFHYGKFELFEKQYANKRNKRPFLYSPPATRAKKRVVSNEQKKTVTTTATATATVPATVGVVKEHVVAKKQRNGIKLYATSITSNASNGTVKATITVSAAAAAAAAKDNKVCLKCYKRSK